MSTTKSQLDTEIPSKTLPRGPKRARTEADESDEGSNGRNRHRVTRACNECRRRKDRCGGQKPSCRSCAENDRVCSYGPSKKRGLRPGYVRAIEVFLGLIITTIEGSEAWICGLLKGETGQIPFRPALLKVQESDMSVDFLLETWRKCSLAKEAGKLLAQEGLETDEDGTESTRFFDTKVVEAFALSQSSKDDDANALLTPMNTDTTPQGVVLFESPPTPVVLAHPSNHSVEALLQTSTTPQQNITVSNDTKPSLSPIPQLPTNWPYLMDVYFETTHSWLPISQKHELLRTAYTVANSSSKSATTPSPGELAFLHAVLIYASHQASTMENILKSSFDHSYGVESPQTLTQSSLFADLTAYDLGHVKAFLILSLFEMDHKNWIDAWITIGRAVYTATSLGFISRNSTTEELLYGDDVKRTVLGCLTLETIIASRLGTATYLQSSDISPKTLLVTDGIEEWEPWQPRILVDTKVIASQQVSNPHGPGYVISTFNRLLQVIAQLNDLIHAEKRPLSDKALHEMMLACQQNLAEDHTYTADIPPQKLCLWMASIATLEIAAAERLASHGTNPWRPDGYWRSIASFVDLIQTRTHSMGHCSVSPVVQSCLDLLQKTIARHQQQYAGTDAQDDFDRLQQNIAASMGSLKTVFNKEPHMDIASLNQGLTDVSKRMHPAFTNDPTQPRTDTISDMSATTFTLGAQIEVLHSSMAQDNISTTILPRTLGLEDNATFDVSGPSLGEDLEDDGLFDSLATLDSTDWLANPPEFMQHLGLLDNPSKSIENIFDMEF
ncbi:hypothetical protein FVEN_g5010 [Fusarium venenatum]|uniref:Zn(2)-C6 fungal-type domain-containing protein n=1 Tax=Fusarium venenatum TaxID=56646 RepID=A0A2L2SZD2_9HYPO|nr:uncharacterized protein FVRRES_06904 [Fusarium venenatum]KAG8356988.1 hypothetical protein FVEN_g5010 [Fusarium venenatum]KAH6993861.1 hypothetical protein EDB82DRAFT_475624 [Fusarium venenatum]CEI62468.1 unnamed protein product [Fusarium venenatum]